MVFANGVEKDIAIGDKRFVYIPLDYKSELLQFNKSINELALQPVMQRNQEHNLINVMWQPIEDAARYVVKLYRYVNTENKADAIAITPETIATISSMSHTSIYV